MLTISNVFSHKILLHSALDSLYVILQPESFPLSDGRFYFKKLPRVISFLRKIVYYILRSKILAITVNSIFLCLESESTEF